MRNLVCIVMLLGFGLSNANPVDNYQYSARSVIDHDGQDNYLYLGNGYDSDKYDKKQFTCLSGSEVKSGNVKQIVETTHNFTFSQARRISSGDLSVSVSSPLMSAGAGAEWAYKVSSSDLSQSINMTIFYKPKKDVLLPLYRTKGVRSLTSICGDIVENRQDLLVGSVGNEFVTAVDYFASLSITLKITSSNKSDKDLLAGALRFSRLGIALDGELSQISEKLSSSARVSLNLKQVGGDPASLVRFGAENGGNALDCSMAVGADEGALSNCLAIFDSAIKYGKNSFKGQLQEPSDYAIASYYTTRYEVSGQDELIPAEASPIVNLYRDMKMIELHDEYVKYRQDNALVNNLLENSVGRSEEYISQLEDISSKTLDNIILVSNIMDHCEINPYNTNCIDYYNNVLSEFHDYELIP